MRKAGNPNVVNNDSSNSSRDLSGASNPTFRTTCRSKPAPFLGKLYAMVVDPETNDIISWSPSKQSFIIWDRNRFSSSILPNFFKHSNIINFQSQLSNYGFIKLNWEYFEYANPLFVEGREDLLMSIKRRNEKIGVIIGQREGNLHDKSLMEVTMEVLRSEQMKLELQLEELRGKQDNLVDDFATIEKNVKDTLEDQESLFTGLLAHLVQQSVIQHVKDHQENEGSQEPEPKIRRLASPDNNSSGNSHEQEDPTLYQMEVEPVTITTPLDDSGGSILGRKNTVDDSAFWKNIMEDDSV